jgi:hypothetical protein
MTNLDPSMLATGYPEAVLIVPPYKLFGKLAEIFIEY